MTKYPKAVWVGFIENDPKYPDQVSEIKKWTTDFGRREPVLYHLHPGNEVARALNTLRLTYHWTNNESDKYADRLHRIGFPVRWDAKKGRFV